MKNILSGIIAIGAIVGLVIGISKINDDYNKRYFSCEQYYNIYIKSYEVCIADAMDTHNKEVNQGWAFAIISGFVGLCAVGVSDKKTRTR